MYLDVPEEFKPLILAQATWTCEISRPGHYREFQSCDMWGKRNVPTKNILIDADACAIGDYGKDLRKVQSWGAGVTLAHPTYIDIDDANVENDANSEN